MSVKNKCRWKYIPICSGWKKDSRTLVLLNGGKRYDKSNKLTSLIKAINNRTKIWQKTKCE